MDVSKNSGTPKSSIFNRVFHYKPSILGYHYFRKHPDLTTSAFSYYKSARQCDVSWRQSIALTTRMELNLDGHVKRVHTVNNQFQDVGNKHKAVVHLVKTCNSCKKGHVLPYFWKQPHMSPKSRCQSMKHESWNLIGMLWFNISYVCIQLCEGENKFGQPSCLPIRIVLALEGFVSWSGTIISGSFGS